VAEVIAVELMMLEETGVQVLAFALLPNHVHVVLHLPVGSGLSIYKSLQLLHQRTAAQCARKLRLPAGADFWQPGFYEYAVADAEELTRIVAYVRNHAARLRLSERWRDWPYVYVNARWAASADALPEG
jgi:REP element-mobilizing transposase RayT